MSISVSIVEDDAGSRSGLDRESSGFACRGAHSSAEEALRAISQNPPDVVLMDINLRGVGIECVRRLKSALPKPDRC